MLEPPSQELVRQLTELQLCRPSDLRRAHARVRRLSFDLTAFDSVWIDSLIQLRLLTPYQGKQLEQGCADQLRIGSFVAIDELGRSTRGTTLLARRLNRRDRYVVKRQRVEQSQMIDVSRQMQIVLERAAGFAHPQLVLPQEIIPSDQNELITVSRFVPGLPLNELLVRRGRFPAAVVLEIGRQLLEGLAALQKRSLVHGDIRMSNVRLTDTGLAVLVDGGTRQVLHREVTIHDTLPLEAYDGLAPELIGTGVSSSASSELYALGCLLWQLLAGRPPFTTADPLAKLAAHQTLTIDDVRVWAPETPAMLAEMICQMTSPATAVRPRGFDEVLQRWGRSGSFGRSRLRQFRRLFNGAVPHFSDSAAGGGKSNRIWITAALFALTGGIAVLYDNGLRTELLEIVKNVKFDEARSTESTLKNGTEAIQATIESPRKHPRDHGPLPLPPASADGVIVLSERGPYAVSGVVTFAGRLTIRAASGVKAEILVDDMPLSLVAQSVSLEHLTVRCQKDYDSIILTKIRSQQLNVLNCEFSTLQNDGDANSRPISEIASLAWSPLDSRDPKSGHIAIKNTVFHGAGAAILFAQTARRLTVYNTLKTGRGAFAALGANCLATQLNFELDHVTLRGTGPLLRLAGELASKTGTVPTQIEASDSVFSLAETASGFIVIDSKRPRADLTKSIELKARESVIAPGTSLLTVFDPARNQFRQVDADEQFDGLVASGIEFAGNNSDRMSDCKTARLQGPRTSEAVDRLPGIDVRHLGPAN